MAWKLISKRSGIEILKNLSDSDGWRLLGDDNEANEKVTPVTGAKITTVFSAINVISQDNAILPIQVKKDSNKGKKTVKNSHVYKLLNRRANPYMNAYHFRYVMNFLCESRGNSYAWIERDEMFNPIALWPINPSEVQRMKDPTSNTWVYIIRGVAFPDYDIFHLFTFTTDGYNGTSKITHNAQLIGLKIKTHRYKARSIGNQIPGYISSDGGNTTQISTIADDWKKRIEKGDTPFLLGADFKQLMFNPQQADIVLSDKWTDTMTLSIWRMQPVMVSIHEDSNYSNAEQQNIIHAKYTLSASITAWEQEINEKLFTERNKLSENPEYVKFNINGLLKGDTTTQMEVIRTMTTLGLWNAKRVMDLMDEPYPEEGGDDYYIQGAMVKKGSEESSQQANQRMRKVETKPGKLK